jgi:hypothetical protein
MTPYIPQIVLKLAAQDVQGLAEGGPGQLGAGLASLACSEGGDGSFIAD